MSGVAPRPKNLTFMVGWLVFLGVYQVFLAWRFGTFFEGTSGALRDEFGGAALEPLYLSIGAVALIIAWGGWHLRPWAYWLAWIFQGLIFRILFETMSRVASPRRLMPMVVNIIMLGSTMKSQFKMPFGASIVAISGFVKK